jgi:hypothetical protein
MIIFTQQKSSKKKSKPTKAAKKTLEEYNAWRRANKMSTVTSLKAEKYSREFNEYKPKHGIVRKTTHIKSLESNDPIVCGRTSIMDRVNLDKEPEHVREQIIAKSKRIAQMYNKGGYQYVTDGVDITTIGTRSRRM